MEATSKSKHILPHPLSSAVRIGYVEMCLTSIHSTGIEKNNRIWSFARVWVNANSAEEREQSALFE